MKAAASRLPALAVSPTAPPARGVPPWMRALHDRVRTDPGRAAATALASLAALGLVAYLVVFLHHARVLLAYPYGVDQGEGYDVWAAWLIWNGRLPYTSNEAWPYFSTNYPPLYFALVAPLLGWLGPTLAAGRAVSIAATLLTGAVVFLAGRRLSRSAVAALIAALLFLASTYVYHVGALARVNALAVLLALAGVVVASSGGRWGLTLGLGLLVLAALTKQTALDALVAVLLWVALDDWRRALAAGMAAVLLGLTMVALLELGSGRQFLVNVVTANANPWDPWQALVYTRNFARVHLALLAGVLGGLWLARRQKPAPVVVYAGTAAIASLTAGKWGAGESYFLELLAAACVVATLAIAPLLRAPGAWGRTLLGAAIGAQLILYAHGAVLQLPGVRDYGFQAQALGGEPGELDLALGQQLVDQYVRRWSGPVLAEDPGFVLAAGKPVVGNATHLRNLYEAGAWSPAGLVRDVESKRFDYVILHAHLYPPPVLAAIGRHYYLYATVRINGYNYQVFAPGAD